MLTLIQCLTKNSMYKRCFQFRNTVNNVWKVLQFITFHELLMYIYVLYTDFAVHFVIIVSTRSLEDGDTDRSG